MAAADATILVLHQPRSRTPFHEGLASAEALSALMDGLAQAGARPVAVEFVPEMLNGLRKTYGPVGVLNMVYGHVDPARGLCLGQPETTALIEQAGLVPLGSDSTVQRLLQDKLACGEFLHARGYATPRVIGRQERLAAGMPVVRKPRFGAAHRGVSLVSPSDCVSDDDAGDVLYQEYVALPEYTVAVVETADGLECFLPLRVDFAANGPCVMNETAKWEIVPEAEDPFGLRATAAAIFRDVGMRDYGRIDFRISGETAVVLDVNSLPNLDGSRSYLPIAAEAAGWTYAQLLGAIARRVLRRTTRVRAGQALRRAYPTTSGTS